MKTGSDFLVIGGGIIGVSMALRARQHYPDASVTLIEKESDCGLHASGRNSGVLHAGFYYTADSLKARLTRDGNRQLTEYCEQRGLGINRCGKLVIAKNDAELPVLDELLARARRNGVDLWEVSEAEARDIEPLARFHRRALFAPATASVDPRAVVAAFVEDARNAGVDIRTDVSYRGRDNGAIRTSDGRIEAGYVINCAGLYADRVARDFSFGEQYRILPFKGLYLYAEPGAVPLRTNIYPVPDLRNPFLGVHHTITLDGRSKIGPTAIPAFWREHYRGLDNFDLKEMFEVLAREADLFAHNAFGFRALAWDELRKSRRHCIVDLAGELVRGLQYSDYKKWGAPGIRAQLLDIRNRKLEMDFKLQGDDRSFHILNAVSPAFTCALPFSEYTMQQIEQHLA